MAFDICFLLFGFWITGEEGTSFAIFPLFPLEGCCAAGNAFWRCTKYPDCNGTRKIEL